MNNINEIAEKLINLHTAYAQEHRAITTQERLSLLVDSKLIADYTYESMFLREPLIEHVGHLPVIASYLHPYLNKDNKVDLGRALIMLSIHDIGETEVGDLFTFTKPSSHNDLEAEVAKKLLPDYLYKYFVEMEERETLDAKFAKAVDALAPILHEMTTLHIMAERFKLYGFSVDIIIEKKHKYFTWDQTLLALFDYYMEKYKSVSK